MSAELRLSWAEASSGLLNCTMEPCLGFQNIIVKHLNVDHLYWKLFLTLLLRGNFYFNVEDCNKVENRLITRLRVDKDKPKGWFKGNWKGETLKLWNLNLGCSGLLRATLGYSGLLWATLGYSLSQRLFNKISLTHWTPGLIHVLTLAFQTLN